ncbi:MAG: D-alanine--D-alanine ligase [Clostridiales bacterium]|nr:D-alanine--D-alanine ligase [Clostridiales bacterium]
MNIVVLAGGLSAERDVSICTGEMVCNALKERGHNAVMVDLFFGYQGEEEDWDKVFANSQNKSEDVDLVGDTVPDIEKMKAERKDNSRIGKNVIDICTAADVVFMALHGEDGENGKVQAMFDLNGIKYTGAGYFSSAIAMNKDVTKQIFIQKGILTPAYTILHHQSTHEAFKDLSYPCVVKPCSGGSSIGVSIVNNKDELKKAIADAKHYEDEVIVEEYICGREFSVGVIDGKVLPIIEIIPKNGFYDYANKYQEGYVIEITPAELSDKKTKEIQEMAIRVFKVLNLEIYSRIDFLMDEQESIYCLEANTLPGMTPTSLLPQEAAAAGIGYNELCEMILEKSLKRYN